MAVFYGKASSHLRNEDWMNYAAALLSVVLPGAAVFIVARYASPAVTAVAALVAIFLIVKIFEPLAGWFKRRAIRFSHGRQGEGDIKKELGRLPDSYRVFQGVTIGKDRGDIDFVVVGPTGVFVIEVKNHRGTVGFDGYYLTLNDRPFPDKNILRQAHGELFAVKNYLLSRGLDVYLRPVLAFANPEARLRLDSQPVANVYVVRGDFLSNLLGSMPPYHHQRTLEGVAAALLGTVER